LCVLSAVVASAASGAPSTTKTTFRDSTGEEPAAPDITTVAVSSDGATLGFRIAVPTNAVLTRDMRLSLWLDADDDRRTGLAAEGREGFDHWINVDPISFPGYGAVLYSCEGVGNTCGRPGGAEPGFSYSKGGTITLEASQLGLKRVGRVRFKAQVVTGIGGGPGGWNFDDAHADVAPDEGEWTFDARPLAITGFRATPARPHAGSLFALTMRVRRSATGAAVTRGDVACALRVGGTRMPARTSRFVGRVATCGFVLPAGTEGRRYRATITVAAEGSTVTRSVSGRVS
jgi:hypothetical protein